MYFVFVFAVYPQSGLIDSTGRRYLTGSDTPKKNRNSVNEMGCGASTSKTSQVHEKPIDKKYSTSTSLHPTSINEGTPSALQYHRQKTNRARRSRTPSVCSISSQVSSHETAENILARKVCFAHSLFSPSHLSL